MPPANSTNTDAVDWLFYGILGLPVVCFVAITVAVVYFTWRYRHRPGHKAEPSSTHNDALEITWTVIPSIICVFLFVFGWEGFVDLFTPPKHAIEVQVVAQKWSWSFKYYKDGMAFDDEVLHVPVGEPVRLVMRSNDVLHSFFVPAFRIKQDVIPNRYTSLWFEAKTPGLYRQFCTEYCGEQHSNMKTWVQVHEPGGYEQWLGEKQEALIKLMGDDPALWGEYLFNGKGCKNCHSIDGTRSTGPSFKGLWGREEKFSDGTSLVVEGAEGANYIRESILNPQARIVFSYPGQMASFQGLLDDDEIDAVIAYIKSLK